MNPMSNPASPTLDRTVEPWLGTFPGLGSIAVAQDGSVEIVAEANQEEDATLRERALRFGWAEGLSLVRRGFILAGGAAVCPPDDSGEQNPGVAATHGVLILTGDPHDVVIVIAELVDRGWSVMSDRFTPVQWQQGRLTAYPREAPVLMASRRAKKLQREGQKVRAHTDALDVDLPRCALPREVTAVAQVSMRRPNEVPLAESTGQKRFESAAGLMLGGVLRDPSSADLEAGEAMADHLRLASLRYSNLRIESGTISEDVDALIQWLANSEATVQ